MRLTARIVCSSHGHARTSAVDRAIDDRTPGLPDRRDACPPLPASRTGVARCAVRDQGRGRRQGSMRPESGTCAGPSGRCTRGPIDRTVSGGDHDVCGRLRDDPACRGRRVSRCPGRGPAGSRVLHDPSGDGGAPQRLERPKKTTDEHHQTRKTDRSMPVIKSRDRDQAMTARKPAPIRQHQPSSTRRAARGGQTRRARRSSKTK